MDVPHQERNLKISMMQAASESDMPRQDPPLVSAHNKQEWAGKQHNVFCTMIIDQMFNTVKSIDVSTTPVTSVKS